MGFNCGIVGLPNVGKSTIFNALSRGKAQSANYPFCTIDPNKGIVLVADSRLDALTAIYRPQKTTPATIEFQTDGNWTPASEQYASRVQAVRVTRFAGAVLVTFDVPQRVKLAPNVWVDTWFTRANCRNILIDLLDNSDKPTPLAEPKTVGYRIAPAPN